MLDSKEAISILEKNSSNPSYNTSWALPFKADDNSILNDIEAIKHATP